jgi:hypothetical protein
MASSGELKLENQPSSPGHDLDVAIFVVAILLRSGKDLPIADIGGTSDPYCVVTAGQQTKQTEVIKKTLNPEWNQKFIFLLEQPEVLKFTVWDWDRVGEHDFLGECEIETSQLFGVMGVFDDYVSLKNPKHPKKAKGELNVKVSCRRIAPTSSAEVEFATARKRIAYLEGLVQTLSSNRDESEDVKKLQEEMQILKAKIEEMKEKRAKSKESEKKMKLLIEEMSREREEKKALVGELKREIETSKLVKGGAIVAAAAEQAEVEQLRSRIAKLEGDLQKKSEQLERILKEQSRRADEPSESSKSSISAPSAGGEIGITVGTATESKLFDQRLPFCVCCGNPCIIS